MTLDQGSRGDQWEQEKWEKGTYINCDLRYFNFDALGKFDIIIIDPPWRIRGGEHVSDEKTMFNNNKFYLQYNTLSNREIIDIDIGILSDYGCCFLWAINSQLPLALDCLKRWGYRYVDRITWVKKTPNENLAVSQGYYFLHSSEMCLIGIKDNDPLSQSRFPLDSVSHFTNDILFAEVKKQSEKPVELYHIIEKAFPNTRKIEIFGRNHNIRKGWLTLGNQLGSMYNCDMIQVTCIQCNEIIRPGIIRYKHRQTRNNNLCANCFDQSSFHIEDYFILLNRQEETVFHEYYECNGCRTKPIWGIRFNCMNCHDLDLCENCYDLQKVPDSHKESHTREHMFESIETPHLAGGLSIHKHFCSGCQAYPIVGYRFACKQCPKLSLCQKCYFLKKEPKAHSYQLHEMELFTDPQLALEKLSKCIICSKPLTDSLYYKCNHCVDFDICSECHDSKMPPPLNHISHKKNHIFTSIKPRTPQTQRQ